MIMTTKQQGHRQHSLDGSLLDDFQHHHHHHQQQNLGGLPLTPPPTLPPSFVRYPSQRSGFGAASSSIGDDLMDHLDPTESDLEEEVEEVGDGEDMMMMEEEEAEVGSTSSLSAGGYSPPAWRRLKNGDRSSGFWRGSDNLLGLGPGLGHHDRWVGGGGGGLDDDDYFRDGGGGGRDNDAGVVLEQAMRTRLPTGSLSPEKAGTPELGEEETLVRMKSLAGSPLKGVNQDLGRTGTRALTVSASPEATRENYIRFAVRADIQQRSEPIEAAIKYFRDKFHRVTKSWSSLLLTVLVAFLSMTTLRTLFQPTTTSRRPVPDLVKVAGIARSFEPLIYYSENGVAQVGDLQATGVAVWDLGESVRTSNMTSAPIIVKSLDELSDSLKTLAIELTKFFANVDGDVDGILIVMDWARRELAQLQQTQQPPGGSQAGGLSLSSSPAALTTTALTNVHSLLCDVGVLEDPATGQATRLGALATGLFGMSGPQRTRAVLHRTFAEFLAVLEEAVASELQHALALFALFEAVLA